MENSVCLSTKLVHSKPSHGVRRSVSADGVMIHAMKFFSVFRQRTIRSKMEISGTLQPENSSADAEFRRGSSLARGLIQSLMGGLRRLALALSFGLRVGGVVSGMNSQCQRRELISINPNQEVLKDVK